MLLEILSELFKYKQRSGLLINRELFNIFFVVGFCFKVSLGKLVPRASIGNSASCLSRHLTTK